MTIEQIDRCCDLFEQRLKAGEELAAEQFLQEQQLPPDAQLLAELQKLERDYRQVTRRPRRMRSRRPTK